MENKDKKTQVIGMVHLKPLPGSIDFTSMEDIISSAKEGIDALQGGGIDVIMIENDGDNPYSEFLEPLQIAGFTYVVSQLKEYIKVPFGFTVLLNDWKTGFALCKLFGGEILRLDTFVDDVERISDGIQIKPKPNKIIEYKKLIGAENVELIVDVHVKHTKLINPKTLEESITQSVQKGADGIIITGEWTGKPPTIERIQEAKKIIGNKSQLIVGSGVNSDNIKEFMNYADKIIVGSSIKKDGKVNKDLAKELMNNSK